jgi:hypothetical protein
MRGAPFSKEISKVKQTIFAVAALAIAAAVPAHALVTDSIPTTTQATYNLAQAYPCTSATYPTLFLGTAPNIATTPTGVGISDLRVWCGGGGDLLTGGAAPGILALARKGNFLDVNCFAVIPDGQAGPCFVQAFQLTKEVPGSFKCPDVYGFPHFEADSNGVLKLVPYRYFQFGTNVRTWWSLNFTQPGTRFILEVVSVCRTRTVGADNVVTFGNASVKRDRWIWRVVANTDTLLNLIQLMHGEAISTLEVPCILGEDMYDALIKAQERLRDAIRSTSDTRLTDIGNAIFDFEALIVANCLFVEVLNPLVTFPGAPQFGAPNIQPPGNLAQTVFFGQGSAVAGIIDTIENPCCCKLLVDLEWITLKNGIIGQTPKLPTF